MPTFSENAWGLNLVFISHFLPLVQRKQSTHSTVTECFVLPQLLDKELMALSHCTSFTNVYAFMGANGGGEGKRNNKWK